MEFFSGLLAAVGALTTAGIAVPSSHLHILKLVIAPRSGCVHYMLHGLRRTLYDCC